MLKNGIALSCILVIGSLLAASPRSAHAYTWMIRHGYTGCAQCHADPSGGGLLTAYGRAQSEVLLRTRYENPPREDVEPGREGLFLFGAVPLPESVLLGGDVRELSLAVRPEMGPGLSRLIFMQADLEAQVQVGRYRANASVGYASDGALAAAITHKADDNLVSRVYWVGMDLGADRQGLVRLGRIPLPFGVRSIEHTMWVRTSTRTNIDDNQQVGLSFAYAGETLRGEMMAIAGNYQVSPDDYRERGYSGYLERALSERAIVGVSSLVTHANVDSLLRTPLWRHAHGLFARVAPIKPLVLLAEVDGLLLSQPPGNNGWGFAGMGQGDLEIVQGLHVMATLETLDQTPVSQGVNFGTWASLAWFFGAHVDARVDAIWQSIPTGPTRVAATTLLAQFHLFL